MNILGYLSVWFAFVIYIVLKLNEQCTFASVILNNFWMSQSYGAIVPALNCHI